jgi:hypothetical protein
LQDLNKKKDDEYQRLLVEFEKGREQYEALQKELQEAKGTSLVLPCSLFLVFCIAPELTLVGVVTEAAATELATKLEQRDATHDQDTKGLRIQAQKAEGLEAKVARLKEEVVKAKEEAKDEVEKARDAARGVLEEAKKMGAEFRKELDNLKGHHKVEIEGLEKSHPDLAGEHAKMVKGYDRKLLELGARERRVEEEVRPLNTRLTCKSPPLG